MDINQVYSLMNDINHQMFGADALDVIDDSGIISMGKSIVGDGTQTDKFFNALVDRIGKTNVRTLNLQLDFPRLFHDGYEYGAIIQKITVDPEGIDAIENSTWKQGEDDFEPTLLDAPKSSVFVRYFTDASTFSFKRKIPSDLLLAPAFAGASQMGAFITGIYSAFSDTMVRSLNNFTRNAINNFMAEKIKANNGVVDLLAQYNTLTSSTLTKDTCLFSKDFLRYSVAEIKKYIKFMSQENVNFNMGDGNGGKVLRATSRNNMHVLALTSWISAVESVLESDTFHNEFVSMPNYQEVAWWQACKGDSTLNDFETLSSIKVIPSSEKDAVSPSDVEQSGIICALIDRQAVGVGLDKRRTSSFYNPIDDYTILKQEATQQMYNDLSENGVLFIIDGGSTPLEDLSVKGADGTYYDHATSTYQSNIKVSGYKITGTLKFVEGGLAESGYLAGDGYFLALSLYDSHAEIESMGDVKVGLKPSMGSGLVSIKGDVDDVIVMKITDKNDQRFEVVSTKIGYKTNIQSYDLSGLKLTK